MQFEELSDPRDAGTGEENLCFHFYLFGVMLVVDAGIRSEREVEAGHQKLTFPRTTSKRYSGLEYVQVQLLGKKRC